MKQIDLLRSNGPWAWPRGEMEMEMEPREASKEHPRERPKEDVPETERVYIRRQWNDWRIGYVSTREIDALT
jgi:hypothetical protein